ALCRHLVQQMADADHVGDLAYALDALLRRDLLHAQAELDVLRDIFVGKQCMALKDHAEIAVARLEIVHHASVDTDFPRGRVLETRDYSPRGRLAASGWSDEHNELAVFDRKGQVLDRLNGAERLVEVDELD